MQDYYSRYLPQMYLAVFIPLLILIAVFPINWAAGIILLATAPLIPLFMALVGMGAADANRRNFVALARLSGNFLDRLRGSTPCGCSTARRPKPRRSPNPPKTSAAAPWKCCARLPLFRRAGVLRLDLHRRGGGVLRLFLPRRTQLRQLRPRRDAVFRFSGVDSGAGVFQPLRDLGTFYHAKAQAIGAAEALETFLSAEGEQMGSGTRQLPTDQPLTLQASALEILSPNGVLLAGPLSFTLQPQQRVALVGLSGAGKARC